MFMLGGAPSGDHDEFPKEEIICGYGRIPPHAVTAIEPDGSIKYAFGRRESVLGSGRIVLKTFPLSVEEPRFVGILRFVHILDKFLSFLDF